MALVANLEEFDFHDKNHTTEPSFPQLLKIEVFRGRSE